MEELYIKLVEIFVQSFIYVLILIFFIHNLNKKLESYKTKESIRTEIGKMRAEAFISVFSLIEKLNHFTKHNIVNTITKLSHISSDQKDEIDKIIKSGNNDFLDFYKKVYENFQNKRLLLYGNHEEKVIEYLKTIETAHMVYFGKVDPEANKKFEEEIANRKNIQSRVVEDLDNIRRSINKLLLDFE